MKRAGFTEEQIIGVLKEHEAGAKTADLARKHDRRLRVVRHQQMRRAADRLEGMHMGVDPVGERLRPTGAREREARRAEHGDEDLRFPQFPGQPVDDDGNAVRRRNQRTNGQRNAVHRQHAG
jgi:hypothetical protein